MEVTDPFGNRDRFNEDLPREKEAPSERGLRPRILLWGKQRQASKASAERRKGGEAGFGP